MRAVPSCAVRLDQENVAHSLCAQPAKTFDGCHLVADCGMGTSEHLPATDGNWDRLDGLIEYQDKRTADPATGDLLKNLCPERYDWDRMQPVPSPRRSCQD